MGYGVGRWGIEGGGLSSVRAPRSTRGRAGWVRCGQFSGRIRLRSLWERYQWSLNGYSEY